tara:strand:- start:232 stop:465 length:234 start_codon:yes stop_codon:yes gene_type:complete
MAEILKISQPAYCMLETGASWPSFDVIEQTIEVFNVSFKRFREYHRCRKSFFKGATTRKSDGTARQERTVRRRAVAS